MATSTLILHRGAVEVPREKLDQVEAPPPEGRWYPREARPQSWNGQCPRFPRLAMASRENASRCPTTESFLRNA